VKKLLTIILLVALFTMLPAIADGRSIRAFFNGQEATVTGIVLRPGEPFTVDLNITPDNEADVWAEIDEPGAPRAYDRLGGDELVPAAFKRCNASAGAVFHWELTVNGCWVNGTAPVNIYYQINGRDSNVVYASGYFTVVEAFIAPSAEPAASADKNVEKTPGPGAAITLAGILVALLARRIKSLG
jgi:sarcinarray family protein